MSENVIILRGFEPAKFAQETMLVVGECVSLTQRTDLGQACANLLEVGSQCLNQDGVIFPLVDAALAANGSSWGAFRERMVMVAGAINGECPEHLETMRLFIKDWNAAMGDDFDLENPTGEPWEN